MKSLSGQLLKRVLTIYLAITLGFFAVEVVSDYAKAREEIFTDLNTALNAFGEPVRLSLWNMDTRQLDTDLGSIRQLPAVTRVTVVLTDGTPMRDSGVQEAAAGISATSGLLSGTIYSRQRVLVQVAGSETTPLGTLTVYSDSGVIFQKMWRATLFSAVAKLLEILALFFLVTYWFNRLLTRPLLYVASRAEKANPRLAFEPIVVGKGVPNELDLISGSINTLVGEASQAIDAYQNLNQELEATVQRRTQALQIANAKLEYSLEELENTRQSLIAATKAKSTFLANMSHEIRTPLNAIIGLSGLALKYDMVPRIHDYMTKIKLSGDHLLGLINDILDYSKIEAGKLDIENTRFSIDAIVSNVVNLIADKAEAKGLKFVCTVDPGIPQALMGDPLRLSQILINFANNAIKFTSEGQVSIHTELTDITPERVHLRFSVTDTGIGMTQDQLGRMFQSFEQADSSITRQYGGTGLGLAISKSLAQAMDGDVGVQSVVGQGSTFWFTVSLGVVPQFRLQAQPLVDLSGRRVLVVDDDDAFTITFCTMLEEMGLVVKSAPRGAAALDMLSLAVATNTPFEVVMMDWLMPDMNGLETVRAVRGLLRGEAPAVVMVTAHRRAELIMGADSLGVDFVLSKPVNKNLLANLLLQIFNPTRMAEAASPQSGNAAAAERMRLQPISGARILLVEDNLTNQQVASDLLQNAGLNVDIAGNGQAATERIKAAFANKEPYDLVLMDMQMPVMDGIAATVTLRQLYPADQLPIVAMTANAMQSDRDNCLAVGMNDFLSKPIVPADLWDVLLQNIQLRPGLGMAANPAGVGKDTEAQSEAAAIVTMLGDIAGLNTQVGLEHMSGDPVLYLSMVRSFVAHHADSVQRLFKSLTVEDQKSAERIAQTLVSVSANLGAHVLCAHAKAAETLLREGQTGPLLDGALITTRNHLAALVTALEAVPGAVPKETDEVQITAEQEADARLTLLEISRLLAEDDPDAVNLWHKHAPVLKQVVPNAVQVEAALTAYAYEAALALLAQPPT